MTWQPLSDKAPRSGQAVMYRLRPNGVHVAATYDNDGPSWLLEGGHQQTARPHHQWIPAEVPAPKVCKEPGCDRPVVARGMCSRHYHRDYKRRQRAKAKPIPKLPPAKAPALERLDPTTRELLRSAIQLHPELGTALARQETP